MPPDKDVAPGDTDSVDGPVVAYNNRPQRSPAAARFAVRSVVQSLQQRLGADVVLVPGSSRKRYSKQRLLKTLINRLRLRRSASVDISQPEPAFKVAYLGNVVTGVAKGSGCVDKPLATLWRNYTHTSRSDVRMQLVVSGGGLRATTKEHGLTEYWAHRLTSCAAPAHFPRLFCWVYRHESRRLRHELRCHAVLCQSAAVARQLETKLREYLALALQEFRKDKLQRQNARLSLANCIYDNPSLPRRKILLSTGAYNYRPPLERSKSAPKLTMIEEDLEEEVDEIFEGRPRNRPQPLPQPLLQHANSELQRKFGNCKSISPIRELEFENEEEVVAANGDDEDSGSSMFIEGCVEPETSSDMRGGDEVACSMRSDNRELMLASACDVTNWLRHLDGGGGTDTLLPDSDEGSLSSGCESASTNTSGSDPDTSSFVVPSLCAGLTTSSLPPVTSLEDPLSILIITPSSTQTSLIGVCADSSAAVADRLADKKSDIVGCVMARVRAFECIHNDVDDSGKRKMCSPKFLHPSMSGSKSLVVHGGGSGGDDMVSLIPIGEPHMDFSSLRLYKRRHVQDAEKSFHCSTSEDTTDGMTNGCRIVVEPVVVQQVDDDDRSVCSDESGYDDLEDCVSSVANIVLV